MPYSIPFARSERFRKSFILYSLNNYLYFALFSTNSSISFDSMVGSGKSFYAFKKNLIYDMIDMM